MSIIHDIVPEEMKMTRVVPMLNQVRELSSAITRGVARIFSEVRTILQTAPYPSTLPSPPPKKSNYVVSLRVFFCIHQMTLATCKILCRVFGSIDWCTSIIYHTIRLHTFLGSITGRCWRRKSSLMLFRIRRSGIRIILLLGSFCRF